MSAIKVIHISDIEKEAFYFNNLCDFTARTDIEYLFITFAPEGRFAESLRGRGFTVYALDKLNRRRHPQAIREVWQILKRENPQIVHTHLFNPSLIGLTVAKWQKRKTVLTRHHSDAIHKISAKLRREIYLKLETHITRNSDHIVAPSKMVRDVLVEWEGVSPSKVSIIPYGQTAERFEAITLEVVNKTRAELGMNQALSLVCISRLFHRKGHKYLFEALAPLIKGGLNANLYLVGTGDYQKHLEKLAAELGIIDRIKFLGWRDDVLAIIASADIIVHPSLEDALSQALIESLMLSRPIIATDISGATDTLNGGRYGKLVPPADAESLRSALEDTIKNIDSAREKAKEGKNYLVEYMDARRVAEQYAEIYRKVLSK